MTKIKIYSDVSLSAVEDIGNMVFNCISTALNVTLSILLCIKTKSTISKPLLKCKPTIICNAGINRIDDLNIKFSDKK